MEYSRMDFCVDRRINRPLHGSSARGISLELVYTMRDISKIEAYYAREKLPKGKPIKILHIWNTAGVGGNIAQAMDSHFHTKSKVLMRSSCDPYNSTIKGKNYDDRASVFLARATAHIPFYDIIHVHGLDKFIPVWKLAFPWKPIFLHYHGTNIRGLWEERRKYWKWADEVFIATPDLAAGAPAKVHWIPNLVNEKATLSAALTWNKDNVKEGVAFSDSRWAVDEAENLAEAHGYELELGYRTFTKGMPHAEYLKELVKYEAYIDVKRDFPGYGDGKILEAHSLTGLEALKMHMTVIRWDGEKIEGLPEYHESRFVTRKLMEIYWRYLQ